MTLTGVLVATFACITLLCLIALASAQLTERMWRERPALALPFAVLGACLVMWVAFLVTWLAPPAGPFVAYVAVGLSVVYCGANRSWRLLSDTGPIALATSGIALMYLGLMYLWRTDVTAFALASTRFVANQTPMPLDHQIPALLAERIRSGASTHLLVGDWNGSDRPPLQSGWILLNDAVFSRLGLDADALPFAAGVVAQLLWIPSLHCLLRVIGVGNRSALIAILFTAATATLLTNTIYTWPKLLSAALACCAMAALIDTARRRSVPVFWSALAAALYALGMLAHAAAAFAIPALVALGAMALRRHSAGTKVLAAAAAATTALAVYAPWSVFQQLYDPPGDRLLKWHLAGVVPIDGRSFMEALVDSYSRISVADYLAARWQNLTAIVNLDLGVGLGSFSEAGVGERRAHEFFDTSIALGLGMPLLTLMAVVFIAHRVRLGELPPTWRRLGLLALLMLPCILLWSLLLFNGGTTVVQSGSHLWILVLLAAPAAWLAHMRPWLAVLAWMAQLALVLAVYVPFFGVSNLCIAGVATLCSGLVILGGVAWWALRPANDGRPRSMV